MSHGCLQQDDSSTQTKVALGLVLVLVPGPGPGPGPDSGPGSAGLPLTVCGLELLALQLVKSVHVLLLFGWRPHSPFSAHTLDAIAGNTFEGHEAKVALSGAAQSGPGAGLANGKHFQYKSGMSLVDVPSGTAGPARVAPASQKQSGQRSP